MGELATKSLVTKGEPLDSEQGSLRAVFSTFDVVDQQGDIVVREAFTNGQSVPLVWSHDWSRPIGRGTVKVEPTRAVFDGQLFLDTTDGLDAFRTIKGLGDLAEYSWGFQILDAAEEVRDGVPIRIITKAEVFEVSPVLVGANRETYTLAIKGKRRLSRGQIEAVITTLQALLGDDAATLSASSSASSPADDGKAAGPLDLVDAYVATLCEADEEALLTERPKVAGLLDEIASANATLDLLLKRIDAIGAENPRELFRQFRRLEGLYGPIQDGRRAG